MRMAISGLSNKQGFLGSLGGEEACFLSTYLLVFYQEYSDLSLSEKKLNLDDSILPKCQLLKSK
jgi:hypothetical protein